MARILPFSRTRRWRLLSSRTLLSLFVLGSVGQRIGVDVQDTDRYGRTIGTVYRAGRFLLVSDDFKWRARDYEETKNDTDD